MTGLQMRLKAARTYSLATRAADAGDCIPPLLGGTTWKPVGDKKVLVLLAEYPDLPFTNGSNEAFDNLLNSKNYTKGGATGSVWQYYYDNSNGQFNPEFTVAGPYRLSKDRAYYKDRPEEMVAEVARLADNDWISASSRRTGWRTTYSCSIPGERKAPVTRTESGRTGAG